MTPALWLTIAAVLYLVAGGATWIVVCALAMLFDDPPPVSSAWLVLVWWLIWWHALRAFAVEWRAWRAARVKVQA